MATHTKTSISKPQEEYTVGWICALPIEQTAAILMLDERHSDQELYKSPNDANCYTLGSIGRHNVVIACLPMKCYGTNQAARAVSQMLSSFPSVKIGFMVGIGAGVPSKDVKIGDVVISTEWTQWDFGKVKAGGDFEHTGKRYYPPDELLSAIAKLRSEHAINGTQIPQFLDRLSTTYPCLSPTYAPMTNSEDEDGSNQEASNKRRKIFDRADSTTVHYGLVASGNQVVKDAHVRDAIYRRLNNEVLCIEMEAAGLVAFPAAIVVRGICDYADSDKSDDWQEYAAAVAAACAKELLSFIQASEVRKISFGKEELQQVLDGIATVRSHTLQDEDHKIANWLTSVDYSAQQNDLYNRRQKGTGTWLLSSSMYQSWLLKKQILFCPGIPGAGKTIVTSTVINDLADRYIYDTSVGVAYIYLDYKRITPLDDLLLSLLKQLAITQSSLPECIKSLYSRKANGKTRPSRQEVIETLKTIISLHSRVFFLIDALDEGESTSLQIFVDNLLDMYRETNINIFATSRFIPEIREKFMDLSIECEIKASDEDLRAYLEGQISQGSKVLRKHTELITNAITEICQGIFLLARLHFEAIRYEQTLKDIKNALKALPSGEKAYDAAYQDIMARISAKPGVKSKNRAHQALLWVTCASRPLRIAELQHALAVDIDLPEDYEPGKYYFDDEGVPEIEDIISSCCGLLTIDEERNIVRLVHFTAQEFFHRNLEFWFPEAHYHLAKLCIIYVSYRNFENGTVSSLHEITQRRQENPLYDYANQNIEYHAQRFAPAKRSLLDTTDNDIATSQGFKRFGMVHLLLDFLRNDNLRSASAQCIRFPSSDFHTFSDWDICFFPRKTPEISAAIDLALPLTIIELIMTHNLTSLDAKDEYEEAPLFRALSRKRWDVVKLLLEKGADCNIRGQYGKTPLLFAFDISEQDREDIELLYPYGDDGEGEKMIQEHRDIVNLLIANGADPNISDELERTPLILCAKSNNLEIAKVLLANGVNVNAKDHRSQTPILLATKERNMCMVELLLKHGADSSIKDYLGSTPLKIAINADDHNIVELLVESPTYTGDLQKALLWAVKFSLRPAISINLLLSRGASTETLDESGQTLLSWAAQDGKDEVLEVLLENNADYEAQDRSGQTPISLAAENGHEDAVRLLLEYGADSNARDSSGDTPLDWAERNGHTDVASLLRKVSRN